MIWNRKAGVPNVHKRIISQLHYHTEYLGKIRKYMEYGKDHPYSNWFSLKPVSLNRGESLILQVLEYAKDNHIVITISVQDIVFIEFESIDNLLLQYANTALTIH
ncbi:MAG: hypothetical protein HDR01_16415 [Lachnospiraceae bacterium]|nr:hypothetical protein [Lachnospiraceae bacterium]